jgi:hypothetical protein
MPASSIVFLTLLAFQYYPYPVPRTPRLPGNATVGGGDSAAIATFNGTFKSADKKYVMVDTEEGNTIRMYITGSTKFFKDDKQVKVGDFHSGEKVTVDAERDARMNLLAVRVTAVSGKKAPDKAERQSDKSESQPDKAERQQDKGKPAPQ